MDASVTCDVVNRRKFQRQESAGDITSEHSQLVGVFENVQGGSMELVEGWTRRINTLKPVTNTDKYYPILNTNQYT